MGRILSSALHVQGGMCRGVRGERARRQLNAELFPLLGED